MTVTKTTFLGFLWLGELRLHKNSIETIPPMAFVDLQNLYLLDLSYNELVELSPRTFDNLGRLRVLNLEGNSMLEHIVPGSFYGLLSLPRLHLRDMNIKYLPDQVFADLKIIKEIYIDGNDLRAASVDAFYNLNNLEYLNISNNPKVNILKSAFENLVSLQFLESDNFKYCCFVQDWLPEENCLPKRDEFSSCQDLMRRPVLKAFLWILGLMAFLCNLFVLVWRVKEKMTVYSLCVMNLAVADFFMGLYMTILASVDAYYSGVYIEYADQWKDSWLCQILGFLNTLSSEASVFSLCVISADRFYKIVFPLQASKFGLKQARIALGILWVFAFILAAVPFLPISYFRGQFYSRSSVCLSLHITNEVAPGWEYSVAVFHGLNFTSFLFIFCMYLYIYIVIKRSNKEARKMKLRPASSDVALARRLILVVATDFLCWIPINIMGKTEGK